MIPNSKLLISYFLQRTHMKFQNKVEKPFSFKWTYLFLNDIFKNTTYQSTKSSIKYTEPSLTIREVYKSFNISVVIGTEDSVSCRINLVKASRSYFQNDRFSCITPVMLVTVISLEKNINFRFVYMLTIK